MRNILHDKLHMFSVRDESKDCIQIVCSEFSQVWDLKSDMNIDYFDAL